jgi:hypothetical protein
MINYKLLAIQSLAPNAVVTILGDKVVWHSEDISQPSDTEILDETVRLEYLEEINEYQRQRAAEYPAYADYLDGVVKEDQDQIDAYIAACQAVKNKYPKVEIDEAELASRKAQALANHQLEEYTKAMVRLAQYQVSLGREEVVENQPTGERIWNEETDAMADVMADVVTVTAIDPVDATIEQTTYDDEGVATTSTIENPLITQDNAERAEAQAVVGATPSEVIDAYNAL